MKTKNLTCLKGMDVVSAQVSDHHPVIHHNLLFWNVMMQAKERNGRFNNGFKLIEDSKQYIQRLSKVAAVIAEIVYNNPSIQAIGMCEGPIDTMHVKHLFSELKKFPWLERLLMNEDFQRPAFSSGNNWGLLMLADYRYKTSKLSHESHLKTMELFDNLANRFQVWEFEGQNSKKLYFALAHLPFSGDEFKTSHTQLSATGKKYCYLINMLLKNYADQSMVFCGDFNINPGLIRDNSHFDSIPIGNSVLSEQKTSEKIAVTVDGILLSNHEKQRTYAELPILGLFRTLLQERALTKGHTIQNMKQAVLYN